MDLIYFNREESIKAKGILGKNAKASLIWRQHFAPGSHIGNCTNLYRKLNPSDEVDFYLKYITYASEHQDEPIYERGLSYTELVQLAEKYKKAVEMKIKAKYDLETYFHDALCHIIVETWDGQQNERDFSNFLRSLGYECSHFDGYTDARFGLDIKVNNPRTDKVSAIQIKPISFFLSNRPDVHKDRINLCRKYKMTLETLGIKTYYAVYVKDKETGDVKWVKNGNGFRFRLNELFEFDENDIYNKFMRLPMPDTYEKLPII